MLTSKWRGKFFVQKQFNYFINLYDTKRHAESELCIIVSNYFISRACAWCRIVSHKWKLNLQLYADDDDGSEKSNAMTSKSETSRCLCLTLWQCQAEFDQHEIIEKFSSLDAVHFLDIKFFLLIKNLTDLNHMQDEYFF